MKTGSYRNFQHRLAEVQAIIDQVQELSEDDWGALVEEQQEDFVRDVVAIRNMARAAADRYFDW